MPDLKSTALASTIAKRLTAVRLQFTWTREELSDRSGVNVHTLKHFERTGRISLERLIAICDVLGMTQELERLFKPRQRIDIDGWTVQPQPQRLRGRRQKFEK